jgi:ATP-binding protein involved in chromosome partitioning
LPAGQPLIWRGPLASKLIMQLFGETVFGETDFLIIDFPPGTGDVQLTIMQQLNLAGAIIVTTPQQIALDDVRRAASMFTTHELNVPILGIIENMSWFTPASHPDEKYFVFGKGGGQIMAEEFNTRLLGQIPLVAEIGEAADQGKSVFNQTHKAVAETFEAISGEIISMININT